MDGEALINVIAQSSGLPEAWAKSRLKSLIEAKGIMPQEVTLGELREILAELMQEALVETKAEIS